MMTDTELKLKGLKVLTEALGAVETEKFVALMMREPFDYTQWQRKLWPDRTVEEISAEAMKFRTLHRKPSKKSRSQTGGSGRARRGGKR
ncbi:MAG: hypothetical protein AB1696_01660 [Planctomycetota bacterium]